MTERVWLTREEMEQMVDRAAEKAATAGAEAALKRIGLWDEKALDDVQEVRGLLDAWRASKRIAWEAAVKAFTFAFLTVLLAGLTVKVWSNIQ
jgi:hypothetical protein